jgi:hypothetical protein
MRPMVVVERWTAQRRYQTGVVGGKPSCGSDGSPPSHARDGDARRPPPSTPLAPWTGFELGAQDEEKRYTE